MRPLRRMWRPATAISATTAAPALELYAGNWRAAGLAAQTGGELRIRRLRGSRQSTGVAGHTPCTPASTQRPKACFVRVTRCRLEGPVGVDLYNFRAWVLLAHLQLLQGNTARAKQVLESVIAWIDADREYGPVYNLRTRAQALMLLGRREEALQGAWRRRSRSITTTWNGGTRSSAIRSGTMSGRPRNSGRSPRRRSASPPRARRGRGHAHGATRFRGDRHRDEQALPVTHEPHAESCATTLENAAHVARHGGRRRLWHIRARPAPGRGTRSGWKSIVVTARKLVEDAGALPLAIDVLGTDTPGSRTHRRIQAISGQAPGFGYEGQFGASYGVPMLRGQSQPTAAGDNVGGVHRRRIPGEPGHDRYRDPSTSSGSS